MAPTWWQHWGSFACMAFRRQPRRPPNRARLAVELLEDRRVLSPVSVFTDSTAQGVQSLRNAIIAANADAGTATDTINLGAGTYKLTLKNGSGGQENAAATGDLDITSTAHELDIIGQGTTGKNKTVIDASKLADRVFQIVNPGTTVKLENLVIQGGLAQDDGSAGAKPGSTDALGGAILNSGGTLTLVNVILQNNRAVGGNGAAGKPGNGMSTLSGSAGGDAHGAQGGGLYSSGGSLSLSNVVLAGNQAAGGRGGNGGNGGRGHSGPMVIVGTGGAGGAGGAAQGGGLFATGANVTLTDTSLTGNLATGGLGGRGGSGGWGGPGGTGGDGQGGALYLTGTNNADTLTGCSILGNRAVGAAGGAIKGPANQGGSGGAGQGGGIFTDDGVMSVLNSTLAQNLVQGGAGAKSGFGNPLVGSAGAMASGTGFTGSSTANSIPGDVGGSGGAAQGGGLYANGAQISLDDATLAGNAATGGAGAAGGAGFTIHLHRHTVVSKGGAGGVAGNAQGGGIAAADGSVTLTNVTVAYNTVSAGIPGAGGPGGAGKGQTGAAGLVQGGGVAQLDPGTVTAQDTLIADNTAPLANAPRKSIPPRSDFFGTVTSGDFNLVGDGTNSTGFTGTHDQVGTAASPINPMLNTLQANANAPPTVNLLPGSPAIDKGGAVTTVTSFDTNNPTTTTSITVANAAAIASTAGPVSILIDGEEMTVTGVDLQNDILTVTRGVNSVSATLQTGDLVSLFTDERGLPRSVNSTDIGATEFQADAGVTMKASPAHVKAGGTITYTITVTNAGPDASAPTLTDTLDASQTLVAFRAPKGVQVTQVPAKGETGTITATLPTLLPGGKATFTLTVKVATSATGSVSNTVSIASLWDKNGANDTATLATSL